MEEGETEALLKQVKALEAEALEARVEAQAEAAEAAAKTATAAEAVPPDVARHAQNDGSSRRAQV